MSYDPGHYRQIPWSKDVKWPFKTGPKREIHREEKKRRLNCVGSDKCQANLSEEI